MEDMTTDSTDSYDYDGEYEHDKGHHSDEAFCSGHVDTHGKWNNGFACPSTPGVRYRCCGTGTMRHCCVVTSSTDVANTSLTFSNVSLVLGITSGVVITFLLFAVILCIIYKILKLYRKQARHTRELYRLHYPTPVSAVTSLFSNSQDSVGQSEHQGCNSTNAIYERNAALQSHAENLDVPPSANQSSLMGCFQYENCPGSHDSRGSMSNSTSFNTESTMLPGFSRPLPVLYESSCYQGSSSETLLPTSSSSARIPGAHLSATPVIPQEPDRAASRREAISAACRQKNSIRTSAKSTNAGSDNSQQLQLSANQLLAILKLGQPGSWESALFNYSAERSWPLDQGTPHDYSRSYSGCSSSLSHGNPVRHDNFASGVGGNQSLNNLGKPSIKRAIALSMEASTSSTTSTFSATSTSSAMSTSSANSSSVVSSSAGPSTVANAGEVKTPSSSLPATVEAGLVLHTSDDSQEEQAFETIPMQLNIPNPCQTPDSVCLEPGLTSSTKL